ncbi:hypothetical protein L0U88_10975 [Flavihumibacter sp. RY-1]|jgi:hypothetical protein|uniref:Preprotein translocase subunit SecB n=1 Tax=Flavihumibacter fluminis TaxID=2909236 RepID=A0ABS9BJ67_9BACT|nr:hypothetical protein [Flavihumibacter fluminis]MCF1715147.1 hypothetical protein [Flavihumibacter fluminis]
MKSKDIKIRFKSINLLSKSMNPKPDKDFDQEDFHFIINGKTNLQKEAKLIVSQTEVKIHPNKNRDILLGSILVECQFQVDDFADILDKTEESSITFPKELDILIKTMSISTIRGIMYSEFNGTYLTNAILPIIFLPSSNTKPEAISKKNFIE